MPQLHHIRQLRTLADRVAGPWARTVPWAVWLVVLGMLVLNWHRLALVPESMNPAQGSRLALAWLAALTLAAGLWARYQPARLGTIAMALAGVLATPADLWPLGALAGLALGFAAGQPRLAWTGYVLLVLLSLGGAYERIFGVLSAESSSTLAQTAPSEAGYFVLHLVTPGWLVNQLAMAATLGFAQFEVRRFTAPRGATTPTWPLLLVMLVMALLATSLGLLQRAMALREGLKQYQQHVDMVEQATLPAPRTAAAPDLDVIWVIGESQSRAFWQLYGYPRETTPSLASLRDELVVLTDAVSPHSYTVQSLMQAAYRSRVAGDGSQVSLLTLLRSAGVRVQWHTAQEQFGPWASPVVRWAEGSNTLQRHGSHLRVNLKDEGEHPDRQAQAALLSDLTRSTAGHKLLVHHMYAAHDPYCVHVPQTSLSGLRDGLRTEAWFGQATPRAEALRCYEGAVRFTDEIVAAYVQALRGRKRPGVLVFVPDHGEDPTGGTGHNADRPSLWHLEIPVVLYANAAARSALGAGWSHLASHADQPFLGSWVYELMLELMGVGAPELALQSPPRMATAYRAPSRLVYPQGRRWDYDDLASSIDLLSATRNALARPPAAGRSRPPLFAHRVNTLLKARQAMVYFDGIEFDVVIDATGDHLLVNHPPMPESGLRVDELLQATASRADLKLWFDFKNPGLLPERALLLLQDLDNRWKLRDRAVIEVPADTPEAVKALYARAGWAVSLYLPDSFAACGGPMRDESCAHRAAAWAAEARRAGLAAFSFDDALRLAVERYMRPLAPRHRFMSWKLSLRANDPRLPETAADLAPLDALIVRAPRRFVWKPTATIGGGRSAVWACGQVAERLVHMPMRPCSA